MPGHWRQAGFTIEQLDSQCGEREAPTTPGCASLVGLPGASDISPRRGLVPDTYVIVVVRPATIQFRFSRGG